jgi:hypothetical protein
VARQMEEPQQEQHMQQQQLLKQQHQQQQHEPPAQQLVATPAAASAPYAPPTGVKKTFYKRKLPCPPATEFSSAEGVMDKVCRRVCISMHHTLHQLLFCIAADSPCSLWSVPYCVVELVTPNALCVQI